MRRLIGRHNRMALATSSLEGKPQVAKMQYAADEDAIYFYTFNDSRKYVNLKENPRVSIFIHDKPFYAQMDGVAEELSSEDAAHARKKIREKNGAGGGYHEDGRIRYFRVRCDWARVRLEGEYPPAYRTIIE